MPRQTYVILLHTMSFLWKQLFLRKMCSWQEFIYKENKANSFLLLVFFFNIASPKTCFKVSVCLSELASFRNPVLHSPNIQEFQMLAVLSAPLFDSPWILTAVSLSSHPPHPDVCVKILHVRSKSSENSVHLSFKKQTFFPVRNCSEEKSSSFFFFFLHWL